MSSALLQGPIDGPNRAIHLAFVGSLVQYNLSRLRGSDGRKMVGGPGREVLELPPCPGAMFIVQTMLSEHLSFNLPKNRTVSLHHE